MTNSREDLASFLIDYLKYDLNLSHVVRTVFDSIGALSVDESVLNVYINSRAGVRRFNAGNLRDRKGRSDLLAHFKFVSPSAGEILKNAAPDEHLSKAAKNSEEYLICDHVVPIKWIEKRLREQSRTAALDVEAILEVHQRLYRRCIITGVENTKLRRDSMPDGWDQFEGNPFDRYRIAGLDWASDRRIYC